MTGTETKRTPVGGGGGGILLHLDLAVYSHDIPIRDPLYCMTRKC